MARGCVAGSGLEMLPLACKKPGRLARKNGSRVSCRWRWFGGEVEADELGRTGGLGMLPGWAAAPGGAAMGDGGATGAGLEPGGGDVVLPVVQPEPKVAEAALEDGVGAVVEG